MNRDIKYISQRLSLRPPQRESLERMVKVADLLSFGGNKVGAEDLEILLQKVSALYPSVRSFEREFPSLCFALATGVGKTRLMGAFISYLHTVYGLKHFFVLAPNLTIYNKLITDFTPNTRKYVFQGIAAFATNPPFIITGENYDQKGSLLDRPDAVHINIFNISKINSEVRGGKSPRIRRLHEYLGQSYFDYLAKLPDLVLLMDESHRYRASAGIRAINELQPVLGLELTATPFIETNNGAIPFQNIIYDYALASAIEDGFVKQPAISTRKDFNPKSYTPEGLETLKLEDGVRMHEHTKVDLQNYALQHRVQVIKPFLLVIARDTQHAKRLVELMESEQFFHGNYKGKVIQVDSSKSGAEEEEMINRLLKVEDNDEPTEIVVHVNMLKEGWDVTNLYTIVPLRAANARTLIEQSIGRGLRLPYGKRTGVESVDRLNIVAHDKFQEILDEANRGDSIIRMKRLEWTEEELTENREVIQSQSTVETAIGPSIATTEETASPAPVLPKSNESKESQQVAKIAMEVIKELSANPTLAPTTQSLTQTEVRKEIVRRTEKKMEGTQLAIQGLAAIPDVKAIVEEVTEYYQLKTIAIPRITQVPKGKARFVFSPFTLDCSGINPIPGSNEILIRDLGSDNETILIANRHGIQEDMLEKHIVRRLIDYNDVDYQTTKDLLFDLSSQMIRHLETYLSEEEVEQEVKEQEVQLAKIIYLQMRNHFTIESEGGFEHKVTHGYDELVSATYTSVKGKTFHFRTTPERKSEIRNYLYNGFQKCLYPIQKFDSYPELIFARILERDAEKWFKPVLGQFKIFYNEELGQKQYNPDFLAETEAEVLMAEVKDEKKLEDPNVVAKRKAAEAFCGHVTTHNAQHGGKPWRYLLIPDTIITENVDLSWLAKMSK